MFEIRSDVDTPSDIVFKSSRGLLKASDVNCAAMILESCVSPISSGFQASNTSVKGASLASCVSFEETHALLLVIVYSNNWGSRGTSEPLDSSIITSSSACVSSKPTQDASEAPFSLVFDA